LSSFIENGKTKMDGKSNAQTEDNLKKLCRFVYFPFRELMTQNIEETASGKRKKVDFKMLDNW
jgi:hypothetical protein